MISRLRSFLGDKMIWLYVVSMPVITWWYVYRPSHMVPKASLADCIVWNGSFPKKSVVIISGLLIIESLMDYYRVGVLIRHSSSLKLLLKQYARVMLIATVTSIYQMLLVCTMGLMYVTYACNWESTESLPFFKFGVLIEDHLATYQYGIHVMYMTWMTVIITGMIIIIFWWLFENPLFGYVLSYILVVLRIGIYGVVDVNADAVYMGGINLDMYSEPIKYIPFLIIVTIVIMKRKDYLRIR